MKPSESPEEDPHRLECSRGQQVVLDPHPEACDLSEVGEYARSLEGPLAVDLFSGGGGLSLGLQKAGFQVIAGVDEREAAVRTHAHHFGGASVQADLHEESEIERITQALEGLEIDLVAGGPPCQPFSRAGQNKLRHLQEQGVRQEDHRRELWKAFVDVVGRIRPRAVLMENVPDLASGRNGKIFGNIIEHLEGLGYEVQARILRASYLGIPQYRHRLFLVALVPGTPFSWPRPEEQETTLSEAISDLPHVDPGGDEEPLPYGREPESWLQGWCRREVKSGEDRVRDHYTRAVRKDDHEAFQQLGPGMRYSDLPEELRRYRADIFDDKYNRLAWNEPSRTITAHLARDGYWYIHPVEHRTLTVREAARIQTFPDDFRFHGHLTTAYRQIGEAVPPLLGFKLSEAIRSGLDSTPMLARTPSTTQVSALLLDYVDELRDEQMAAPWRRGGSLWKIFLGILLFQSKGGAKNPELWSHLAERRWATPDSFLADSVSDGITSTLEDASRLDALQKIAEILEACSEEERDVPGPDELEVEGLSRSQLDMAYALAGEPVNRPLPAGLHRLALRVFGEESRVENESKESGKGSKMLGQLFARCLTGVDSTGRVYGAALEVADMLCTSTNPRCSSCPLNELCMEAVRENPPQVDIIDQL